MKGFRARLDYILKHNTFINKLFKFTAGSCIRLIGLFVPVKNNAVLFSGHGRKYNDSPRAIYEYMMGKKEFENFTFYWAVENPEKTVIPGRCIKVKPDTFKYFVTALKCKYWITCVNIERSLKFKKKKTLYLNTWHGIPIKTVGNEASNRKDYDFSYINFFCISGDFETDIYYRAFNLKESQIIKTGLPRNDNLYNVSEEEIKSIKRKIGLPEDKKIILYAPTWRDSKDGGKSYQIKPPIDIDYWKKELKDEYILLFRTHPYTSKLIGVNFDDFVRDYINYPDVNDLLKVSDILISDYSAVIFDYSILEKPIISFAYDYEEYGKERGFSIDIKKEMPGGICETENQVIDRIKNMDFNEEVKMVKVFKNKYCKYGGSAIVDCVKTLFDFYKDDII